MTRLNLVVEGRSEQNFALHLLIPYLSRGNVFARARQVETSRNKRKNIIYRGGVLNYQQVKKDLERWMREDQNPEVYFSTLIDFYRLPSDFPGYNGIGCFNDPYDKIKCLEQAFDQDMSHPRFIPYIQLHEFEALLLCDPSKFDHQYLNHDTQIKSLQEMVSGFESPELIDDGTETAPSKRIIKEIPEYAYQKAVASQIIAENIGLDMMRSKCPHFNRWLEKLEALG